MSKIYWFYHTIIDAALVVPLGIISIYWLIIYIKESKNHESCKNRHSIIIDISLIIQMFNVLLNGFTDMLMYNYPTKFDPILKLISSNMLTPFVTTIVVMKLFQHVYLLHYDIQFNKGVKEEKWKKLIDNSFQTNWYINNKQIWGNKTYVNRIVNIWCTFQFVGLGLSTAFILYVFLYVSGLVSRHLI